MQVKFYGTRGNTHVKNKYHKKICGTVISIIATATKKTIKLYIDCGYNKQLNDNAAIILTKIPYKMENKFESNRIYATKTIARELKLTNNVEYIPGQKINILGINVLPIHTIYKLDYGGIGLIINNLFISHCIRKVPNIKYWCSDIKYYIGDGSSFKSILSQIKRIRETLSKNIQCWFTNCGADIIRNHKVYSNLINDRAKISCDNMRIFDIKFCSNK